jgi:prolipoprotein diacylglyceryltransferase
LAGLGRFIIEFFRPDQPHLGTSWLSFTQLATILMMMVGLLMLAIRFGMLKFDKLRLPEKYQLAVQNP